MTSISREIRPPNRLCCELSCRYQLVPDPVSGVVLDATVTEQTGSVRYEVFAGYQLWKRHFDQVHQTRLDRNTDVTESFPQDNKQMDCALIWASTYPTNLNRTVILQKKNIRFISFLISAIEKGSTVLALDAGI